MLNVVELLSALFFSALSSLIALCVVVSVVAALRAVSRGHATRDSEEVNESFGLWVPLG